MFPGTKLRKSAAQEEGRTFVVADGIEMKNQGEFDVIYKTHNNLTKKITFQNANVGMAIMSMTKRADEGHFIGMGKKGGYIEDEVTGERVSFIRRAGVYFMKMKVPVCQVTPPSNQGFTPP